MEKTLKTMTESEYYFGAPFSEWDQLLYFEAIEKRRDLCEALYHKLLTEESECKVQLSFAKRERLWKVEKALSDTKRLINERNNLV